VNDNLNNIQRRGIQVSIDNFGTGYASLTFLQKFPIDVLKIDRTFVNPLAIDKFDRRFVAGIIALADRLHIPVTAEGVEHTDQAALLQELGCASAQGWLYSKAVPPEQIDEILRSESHHRQ
jgi:EAL domain-containing protein (putative c-di-GMP-specific phosphodiesterase class I)